MKAQRLHRTHSIHRRNRFLITSAVIALLIISSLFMIKAKASHRTPDKQVTSVLIEEGDSLWSIAERYCNKDTESVKDVINEIREINGLTSDKINKGMYLIVPYER